LRKLMAVTKDEVETIATKLFTRKPLVTAYGPLGDMEDYKSIVKRLSA
jgi:hypothetical protein